MTHPRQTATLVALAAAMLAAALYAPTHGGPDPATMLTILVGSLVASIAGMAFSAICGTVLLHTTPDPVRIIFLLTLCSFANQTITVWSLRHQIDWRRLAAYVAGGAAGILPGLWALLHCPPHQIAPAIGAVLLAYALHLLRNRPLNLRVDSPWADAAIGFAAAGTGAVSTLPSLPVTIWCQARGLDKDRLRATVQPFVLAMQILTLPLLARAVPTGAAGLTDLLCIPASLFGTQIGLGCVRGLSNRQFALALSALLFFCGLSLCL